MAQDMKNEAQDTEKFAQALEDLMRSLAQVMDQEVQLLEQRDVNAMLTLRETKARLARDYQMNIESLARSPDRLKGTGEDLRARLRRVGQTLEEATQRNLAGLKAAIGATQALVQTVVDVARKDTRHTDCYSDPRKSPLMLGSYSPISKPVAVDRTA